MPEAERIAVDTAFLQATITQARVEAHDSVMQGSKLLPTKLLAIAAILGLAASTIPAVVLLSLPLIAAALDDLQQKLFQYAIDTANEARQAAEVTGSGLARAVVEHWMLSTQAGQTALERRYRLPNSVLLGIALAGFQYGAAASICSMPTIRHLLGEPIACGITLAVAYVLMRLVPVYNKPLTWTICGGFIAFWLLLLTIGYRMPPVTRLIWGS